MISGLVQPAQLLAKTKQFPTEIYFWLGLLAVLAITLGLIALWLRKRLIDQRDDQPPIGFTLKDLRAMHAAGHLSDEELSAAEEKALAKSRSHYLGNPVPAHEEPEDIGHLSTGDEDDPSHGTENTDGVSDKNPGDEPRA